jgi:hypothetical protein
VADSTIKCRRWFRFSLASLLLVITAVGIWLGALANTAQKQMRAVQLIRRLAGNFNYDYQAAALAEPQYPEWLRKRLPHDFLARVTQVFLAKSEVTDDDLRILARLPHLNHLELQDTKVSDNGIKYLAALTKLETLHLNCTACTDTGLMSLASLTRIKRLSLSQTQITDTGLAVVHSMPSLTALTLGSTRISDAGLTELRGLRRLEILHLSDTEITEAGLAKLRELPALYGLGLPNRVISPTGISALRQFPKLRVIYIEPTDDCTTVVANLQQSLPGVQVIVMGAPGVGVWKHRTIVPQRPAEPALRGGH